MAENNLSTVAVDTGTNKANSMSLYTNGKPNVFMLQPSLWPNFKYLFRERALACISLREVRMSTKCSGLTASSQQTSPPVHSAKKRKNVTD
jgi:hypothetical protein